jgi:hypothetical protein
MLAPIELDREQAFCTEEVEDEGSARVLAAKFDTCEAATTQMEPERSLCVRRSASKLASPQNRCVHRADFVGRPGFLLRGGQG